MKALTVSLALLALCAIARAQEALPKQDLTPEAEASLINLSDEHIECVSFYSTVMVCVEKQDSGLAERAHNAANTMLDRAVTITEKAKMKFETIEARSKLYRDSMSDELGKDCRNLSILLEKYGKTCKSLFENPAARESDLLWEQLKMSPPTTPR
jgi:hypothetical protein